MWRVSALLLAASLQAEVVPEIRVTSEFVAKSPGREILSPTIPRNAWSSFHVTVSGDPTTSFTLHIGQNPEDFARVELYRDRRRVSLPYESVIPAGASSVTLWLDLWVARDADVRRFKLEPQVFIGKVGWIIYPMEVRVIEAQVPPPTTPDPLFPSPPNPIDFAKAWLCGTSVRLSRNLQQDSRLASQLPREAVRARLQRALDIVEAPGWCENPKPSPNPEWYLRFREFLFEAAKSPQMLK